MSKELTPLEALEIIKNAGTIYVGCASNIYTRYSFEIKIIEKALKDYEKLQETRFVLYGGRECGKTMKYHILKKLKALEIFKNHITNISFKYGGKLGNVIKLQIDSDTCYIHFDENDKNFDFLKEVLE